MDENKVRQIATDVYRNLGSRFGVNQVPTHVHNGIDSPQLPQFIQVGAAAGQVFSSQNTVGQIINVNPETGIGGNSNIYTVPIPTIYGQGVGFASQFNGGDAPPGSMLIFMNTPVGAQLWWRAYSVAAGKYVWYGVDAQPGYGNAAQALGPIA